MKPDWRDRHPFTVGQRVRLASGPNWVAIGPQVFTVTMRGEDAYGPWIAVNDGWQRLDARHYEAEQMEAAK